MRIIYNVDECIKNLENAKTVVDNQNPGEKAMTFADIMIDATINYLNKLAVNVDLETGEILS